MDKQYSYPLDLSWSTDEIAAVLSFLNQVELAYEGGVDRQAILSAYQQFKTVVPSKGQERQIDRDFEAVSGYSTYKVVQAAKNLGKGKVSLGN
ncbi:UPF0223 family protein [Streptococcus moroccensis]|uniref:UPF0223 protein J2S23_001020 n=1 Tax=Streptococcus moroccensis TaxID=1451356 RepID=A0ABT9YSY7_9STRE|nr:UPF0223 family protein [Streptococcus moroccensis]MDQ0222468.1 uncharacterized protein YktA (UPF0223 family) [Streptococcus moroccensis]